MGSWKKFCGYVYRALMGVAGCIYGNCFVGKYFVVCFSTKKFYPLPPKNTRYMVYSMYNSTENVCDIPTSSSLAKYHFTSYNITRNATALKLADPATRGRAKGLGLGLGL